MRFFVGKGEGEGRRRRRREEEKGERKTYGLCSLCTLDLGVGVSEMNFGGFGRGRFGGIGGVENGEGRMENRDVRGGGGAGGGLGGGFGPLQTMAKRYQWQPLPRGRAWVVDRREARRVRRRGLKCIAILVSDLGRQVRLVFASSVNERAKDERGGGLYSLGWG